MSYRSARAFRHVAACRFCGKNQLHRDCQSDAAKAFRAERAGKEKAEREKDIGKYT